MYLSRILVLGDEFPKLKIIDFGVWLDFIEFATDLQVILRLAQ